MSLACEAEIGVQNELALRFTIVSKPTPVLEYIKTISSLVGASHILAVFEENDTLKVFFDDKRFIDALIRSGIHVMGHHVRVDYVVPPGIKVVLSNIDPVVSNYDLTRLLSMYGTIVSPIICPPISDDMEFCHIGYGVRYCYMTLNEAIPNKLEFKYGDQLCMVKIKVGEEMNLVPFIKTDDSDIHEAIIANDDIVTDLSNDVSQDTTNPVVISVESAASESSSELHIGVAELPLKRSHVKRKCRSLKTLKIKRTRLTPTAKAAKKIKHNVKHKWIGARIKPFRRGRRGKKIVKILKDPSPPRTLSPTSSSDVDSSSPTTLMSTENKEPSVGPLSEEKLLVFIEECKHNRAPIELAKKYLGINCNDDMIHSLINQIEMHSKHSSMNLKLRLGRLCKLLTESVNAHKS